MRLGKLNRVVTIQKWIEVGRTPTNAPIMEWVTVGQEWAELTHKSEDEKHAASQTYAERIVTFRMHYRDDITEVDRLICDGRQYDIKGIRELGYREGIEIAARWHE